MGIFKKAAKAAGRSVVRDVKKKIQPKVIRSTKRKRATRSNGFASGW